MPNSIIVLLGKFISFIIKKSNMGSGATWPGHIALKLNKNFISDCLGKRTKIVLIAGTNGKTTTATLISHILIHSGLTVAHNKTGANQLNGIASTIVSEISILRPKLDKDFLILEADENVIPDALKFLTPDFIICLNLFRDQLDRYGEIDSIVKKWKDSFEELDKKTTLILNADDPQIAILGKDLKIKALYFGLNENLQKTIEHGADSIYCPNCQSELTYKSITFSHLGNWRCSNCKLERPRLDIYSYKFYPLHGTYNRYSTLVSVLFSRTLNIASEKTLSAIKSFKPAFGRQEEFIVRKRIVTLFLSKNPTSFNVSLKTIKDLGAKNILIVLNDQYVDGVDVSWIWDIDFENLVNKNANIAVSGQRVYDMALRLKYANLFTHVEPNLNKALGSMIDNLEENEKLFILPNYSAMLETRKNLLGRKLL